MASLNATEQLFLDTWTELGSTKLVSQRLQLTYGYARNKRKRLEKKLGHELVCHNNQRAEHIRAKNPGRTNLTLKDGVVIVFSDAHYYPDDESTAHRALVAFTKQFRPEIVVCNGDAFSGESISRWPRIGWDNKPTVKQEIDAVKYHLDQLEEVSKGKMVWCLGNHDARYETFLAHHSPQYEGIHGFTLKDHFPRWTPTWSLFINDDVVIKHRYKGGIHATHNNTVAGGVTMVTGHLHSLKVTPFTDYTGTRYGVDTGCLASTGHKQFADYTEDNPKNWRSGFAVLTFRDGKLLPPELVQVWDEEAGLVTFRGAVVSV
jgi:predicted phosphodiesterase